MFKKLWSTHEEFFTKFPQLLPRSQFGNLPFQSMSGSPLPGWLKIEFDRLKIWSCPFYSQYILNMNTSITWFSWRNICAHVWISAIRVVYIHLSWLYRIWLMICQLCLYSDVFCFSACLWLSNGFTPSEWGCSLWQGLCWGLRSSNYKCVGTSSIVFSKPNCTILKGEFHYITHCQNIIFPVKSRTNQ